MSTRRKQEVADDIEAKADDIDCPECGGRLLPSADECERVCEDCGVVVDGDNIDRGPEWRSFENDTTNKSRVGAPLTNTRHDKGLSTKIGWGSNTGNNSLSAEKRRQMGRLRREHKRAQSNGDRRVKTALTEINRMCSALGLPDSVNETAAVIFRRYKDEKGNLTGRSLEEVAGACIHIAAKQCRVPRTFEDIRRVCRGVTTGKTTVDHRSGISRTYRDINQYLKLEIEPTRPEEFFDRIISDLDLEDEAGIRQQAVELIENLRAQNKHSGSAPHCLASAAIYCACRLLDHDVTQSAVAEAGGVTVMTIRQRYIDIVEVSDFERTDIVSKSAMRSG